MEYGASVWSNVSFADVYYETRGSNEGSGYPDSVVPRGRPIPGAFNVLLDDGHELPDIDDDPYPSGSASGDHSYVWKCFYLGTVIKALPDECSPPEDDSLDFETIQAGYSFSRIGSGLNPHDPENLAELERLRPPPTFFNTPRALQDHRFSCRHSDDCVVDNMTGQPVLDALERLGLTEQQFTHAHWEPEWNPLDIVNGDFEKAGNRGNILSDIEPGWSHHGGGGEGDVEKVGGNFFVQLTDGDESRTHNWLYVPHYATHLVFDLRRYDKSPGEKLEVRLGGDSIASYELDNEDDNFVTQPPVDIPARFRGSVNTVTFVIIPPSGNVDAEMWVDNVQFRGEECTPPPFRDWVVVRSCILRSPVDVPRSVIVQMNVALTIPGGTALDIDFSRHHIRIKDGAKVVVNDGGEIH
jgi:hypothetical protein